MMRRGDDRPTLVSRWIRKCRNVAVLLLALASFPLAAQTYNFRNYSVNDGLPFIQAFTIFQDSKGYLWSGGYGGLSRFDGKNFTNFSPRNGLPSHWITSIAEDVDGRLWIGTIKGVSVYDGKRFRNFSTANEKKIPDDNVTSVLVDAGKQIWLGTGRGLVKCSYRANGDTVIFEVFGNDQNPSIGQVNCLYEDKKNSMLWLGTNDGVISFDLIGGKIFNRYRTSDLVDNTVKAITRDKNGELLIGTPDGVFKLDKDRFVLLNPPPNVENPKVSAMLTDSRGNTWIGAENGLYKYDGSGFTYYHVARDRNGNTVGCLFEDFEGNLWLGTYSGLFRYRGGAFITYGVHEGLNSGFIYQIIRAHDGSLWVGTLNGGISHADAASIRSGNISFTSYGMSEGLPSNQVNGQVEDSNGVIWTGGDRGLARFNGSRFEQVPIPDNDCGKNICSMIFDHRGRMWLGLHNGIGCYENGKFTCISFPKKARDYDIFYLHEDKNGVIWAGSYLGGLYTYDGTTVTDAAQKLGMKSDSYFSIIEDSKGWMYFATLDGVYIYDGQSTRQITELDGLSSELTYLLALDNHENDLWIGTNQGLNKIDMAQYRQSKTVSVLHFGKEEGFTGVECNTSAVCKLSEGEFWFGTVNGLIRYHASEYRPNSAQPRTILTGMRLFYKDTSLSQNATLDYFQNNISFEYTGICLTNPQMVRYKHKLEGFDKDWSPESSDRVTTYSNLPPGTYTFKVMSKNNEGVWSAKPETFTFTIETPYWKKLWFWLLLLGIASLGLFAAVSYRIQQIKRRERQELQTRIELATTELKALRAQMNPHFVFNSLNSIQHFILNSNAQDASKYLNKFARLIRMILYNSEKPVISIKQELEALNLYLELEALRFDNSFDYQMEIGEDVDTDFFEIPPMLLQPYIENAILHGLMPLKERKGKLDIHIRLDEPYLVCTIRDNGIGRAKAQELKQQMPKKDHKSMGMRITEDRLALINRLHNSDLSLEITDLFDDQGEPAGTQVDIFIPLN